VNKLSISSSDLPFVSGSMVHTKSTCSEEMTVKIEKAPDADGT
jgi:hypothetical protein